jgi:hypothetical protein
VGVSQGGLELFYRERRRVDDRACGSNPFGTAARKLLRSAGANWLHAVCHRLAWRLTAALAIRRNPQRIPVVLNWTEGTARGPMGRGHSRLCLREAGQQRAGDEERFPCLCAVRIQHAHPIFFSE